MLFDAKQFDLCSSMLAQLQHDATMTSNQFGDIVHYFDERSIASDDVAALGEAETLCTRFILLYYYYSYC